MPLGALLLFAASLALAPMTESDLFFRLAAGREILARHALPSHNLFSFTAPDFPDLDASWLFEVGAALLFRRGGFPVVVVAKAVVVACDRGGGVRALPPARRRAGVVGARGRGGALGDAGAIGRAPAHLLVRRRDRRSCSRWSGSSVARASRVPVVALLAGVVLWANLHAGVFVAPLLLALFALGAAIDRRRALAAHRWRAGAGVGAARCWRRRSARGSFATSRCT